MRQYALVFTTVYVVMLYSTWLDNQIGCVLKTSDNRDYLESIADDYNLEMREEQDYDDMEEERQYMRARAANDKDLTEDEMLIYGLI